jgi:osmotically-inducible protein OsmY
VDLIQNALSAKEVTATKKEQARKLEDLYLAEQVRIDIQYEQQLPIHLLEVEAVDGVITLKGTAGKREFITRCESAAAGIPGVTRVVNQISFIPEYTGA